MSWSASTEPVAPTGTNAHGGTRGTAGPTVPGLGTRQAWSAPAGAWRRPKGAGEPQDDEQLLAVRVMDNPLNTVREVIDACSRALPVSEREAFRVACTIDHAGSCVVCVEPRAEAERVAAIIQRIGIEARLEPYAPET